MNDWTKIPARDRELDPNSALIWLRKLEYTAVPMPKSRMVRVDPAALWAEVDGPPDDEPVVAIPWHEIASAAGAIGYPCFIRTDLSSAKHDGPSSYRADGPDDLRRCVMRTFMDNAMKDLAAGPTPLRAIVIRQWIDLASQFTAFGGHPIAPEWRYFVDGGRIVCRHFYWPDAAVANSASVDDWPARLQLMREQASLDGRSHDIKMLEVWAARVGEALGGAWSVDFALDSRGFWWFIDAARAESSWHETGCPHARKP